MSGDLALGPGAEFDVIRRVADLLGDKAGELGDDCALLTVGGTTLALTIDASVEGVHFRTEWLRAEDIGWRACMAALSDLAAEGAQPLGVLVSVGGPAPRELEVIMRGVGDAAGAAGARVLGGDIVRSDVRLVDVCAVGQCERPVRRSGARPGDGLWVTGTLGGARLALETWQAGKRSTADVARRFARPEARVAGGLWLARHGATAMIDISDGLAADARHLAAASRVAITIALERVPCVTGAAPILAVASGEEYELLVTMPASFDEAGARAFREAVGVPLTRVGACEAGGAAVRLTDRGTAVAAPAGFDHFERA